MKYIAEAACVSKGLVKIVLCIVLSLVGCKDKRVDPPSGQLSQEEIRVANLRMEEDRSMLEKTIKDSLPLGWKLEENFRLGHENYDGANLEGNPEIIRYTCRYVANPTTIMVEEGSRETRFAVSSFASRLLFPTKHQENLPDRLRYPGKNPPPSVEDLMKGKTFVTVRRGHMGFSMKAEIRRSGELPECVIIEPPKPTGLQEKNMSIYPLDQIKPETYLHGNIRELGLDPKLLISTLVEEAVAKREAELMADGVDVNKERERIGAIQRLQLHGE